MKYNQMTWKDLKAMCKKHKIKDSARLSVAIDEKHGELVRYMPIVRFGVNDECPKEDVIFGTAIPVTIDYEFWCETLERELAELRSAQGHDFHLTEKESTIIDKALRDKPAKKRGK